MERANLWLKGARLDYFFFSLHCRTSARLDYFVFPLPLPLPSRGESGGLASDGVSIPFRLPFPLPLPLPFPFPLPLPLGGAPMACGKSVSQSKSGGTKGPGGGGFCREARADVEGRNGHCCGGPWI